MRMMPEFWSCKMNVGRGLAHSVTVPVVVVAVIVVVRVLLAVTVPETVMIWGNFSVSGRCVF